MDDDGLLLVLLPPELLVELLVEPEDDVEEEPESWELSLEFSEELVLMIARPPRTLMLEASRRFLSSSFS